MLWRSSPIRERANSSVPAGAGTGVRDGRYSQCNFQVVTRSRRQSKRTYHTLAGAQINTLSLRTAPTWRFFSRHLDSERIRRCVCKHVGKASTNPERAVSAPERNPGRNQSCRGRQSSRSPIRPKLGVELDECRRARERENCSSIDQCGATRTGRACRGRPAKGYS